MFFLINFISILATALTLTIFIQALMSWFMPLRGGALAGVLRDITEPILQPIRRILPPVGGWDFSPILAMVLVQVISSLLISFLQHSY
ncbi:MAG: YggT family protein [Chloroflexota bacterium]